MIAAASHDPSLKAHIMKKMKWSEQISLRIDWDSHCRAFRQLPCQRKFSIAKLIHGLANTNRQNHLYYKMSKNLCRGCQREGETFEYVLLCSYSATQLVRHTAMLQFDQALASSGLPSSITKVLLHGFSEWFRPPSGHSRAPTFGSVIPVDVTLTAAYTEQYHTLAWYNFALGRVSHHWAAAAHILNWSTGAMFDPQ